MLTKINAKLTQRTGRTNAAKVSLPWLVVVEHLHPVAIGQGNEWATELKCIAGLYTTQVLNAKLFTSPTE